MLFFQFLCHHWKSRADFRNSSPIAFVRRAALASFHSCAGARDYIRGGKKWSETQENEKWIVFLLIRVGMNDRQKRGYQFSCLLNSFLLFMTQSILYTPILKFRGYSKNTSRQWSSKQGTDPSATQTNQRCLNIIQLAGYALCLGLAYKHTQVDGFGLPPRVQTKFALGRLEEEKRMRIYRILYVFGSMECVTFI